LAAIQRCLDLQLTDIQEFMMKLLIMLALVVVMTGAGFSRDQERMISKDELIREMDSKLTAALLQGNAASVDAMLADDYIEINAQGLVRHKPDVMATVRAQASVPRSISVGPETTVDETKLLLYGDTAILVGLTTTRYQHMEYQTSPQPGQLPAPTATYQERFMKVYSRLNGRWQLVASQTTAIAKR
jgi:hypothetical protein